MLNWPDIITQYLFNFVVLFLFFVFPLHALELHSVSFIQPSMAKRDAKKDLNSYRKTAPPKFIPPKGGDAHKNRGRHTTTNREHLAVPALGIGNTFINHAEGTINVDSRIQTHVNYT